MKKSRITLFLIAFVEGGALLAFELICARILSPYFGASLYVWATVLGITLTGLTIAYFLGGYLSSKFSTKVLLSVSLFLSTVTIVLLPYFIKPIIDLTGNMELPQGAILATLALMLPFLILIGMIPVFIINTLSINTGKAGSSTGTVFCVSTIGAICFAMWIGFYMIPLLGVFISLDLIAVLLILTFVFLMIIKRNFKEIGLSIIPLMLLFLSPQNNFDNYNKEKFVLHEESDGLLGHLLVAENIEQQTKFLFINGLPQTVIDSRNSKPLNHYVNEIENIINLNIDDGILILGMGGGSLAASLVKKNIEPDIVELDKRLTRISKTYFGLDLERCNIYYNDARNYIKTTNKKYAIIIVDVYAGDQSPSHVLTYESLMEMKKLLLKGGSIVIYHPGNSNNEKALDILASTSTRAGFNNHILSIGHSQSNVKLLICSEKGELPKYVNLKKTKPYSSELISENKFFLDDKPYLEILQMEEIKSNSFRRIFWKSFFKRAEK